MRCSLLNRASALERGTLRRPDLCECAIMNPLVLLAEPQSGGQIEEIARTFGVNWPHLRAQIISFSIAVSCALPVYLPADPQSACGTASTHRRGPCHLSESKPSWRGPRPTTRKRCAKAAIQAAHFLRRAALRPRVREQETQKAIATAEQIMVKAREAAASDHTRMLAELKQEVGRLVVETTAAVTGKILTAEDQQRLAEETAKNC